MKEHFCPVEKSMITYQGKCNWCGEKEWVGLTDEEVRDLWSWSATSEAEKTANTQQHAFARAIEAKLKEKNT